jgi:5-methylcytosine-specific restriction endonuclease McrA
MRTPCSCGETIGIINTKNGQDCVYCKRCHTYAGYNAPKYETGRAVRPLRTRPDIKTSQRTRVLDRDNGACIICHRTDVWLDVGHIVSVAEGRQLGLTDAQLFDDENLAAMCQPCNSGFSAVSINPRLFASLVIARINRRDQSA